MDSYEEFQDQIFEEMQNLRIRERTAVFESFVQDMSRIGITINQLIDMTKGCATGTEFLRRAKAAAIARGATIAPAT